VRSKTNIIVNRIGAAMFFLGVGGCIAWFGFHRGYPWFQGVGIALAVIGSIMGNMTIHGSEPSVWQSLAPEQRAEWFSQSIQSLAAQHTVVTRLGLLNLLVREMHLPLDEGKRLVDEYCLHNAPAMPLTNPFPR
jgi:hypothetical protein